MKTADFITLKKLRSACAIACLLVFHSVAAKSDAPPPETFNESSELILTLPDNEIKGDEPVWSAHSFQIQNGGDGSQIMAGGKKKTPLDVNCGMDVYQNTAPDVPLGNRLTGECDLKYHY